MKKPNITVEVFMSLIKWFFVVLLLNNLAWVIATSGTREMTQTTSMQQDGSNNYQEMSNG